MLNEEWHLNKARTNDDLFCFENDDEDVVLVPKSFTTNESTARAIASEIQYNRKKWFDLGVDVGRHAMASDLRDLLNVPQRHSTTK